jgi:hypothetical protein
MRLGDAVMICLGRGERFHPGSGLSLARLSADGLNRCDPYGGPQAETLRYLDV